jgi:hypothetical protein
MDKVEQNFEVFENFRDSWRAIGWWAETYTRGHVRTLEYRATLISPIALGKMLDDEYDQRLGMWNYRRRRRGIDVPPERPKVPSAYQMYEAVWSVGETALQACGGAILVAKHLYPQEMPTPKQFKHALQATRPL